jgi:large subunit ribosomal protein L11
MTENKECVSMPKTTISAIVEGGKASSGPPLGPALGPMGVNVKGIIDKINELTKAYAGLKVPVKVIIDSASKEFDIEVGSPPTSELIKGELKIESGKKGGPEDPKVVGDISIEQVIKIAKMKKSLSKGLKGSAKEVLGTCLSMGVTCGGKDPRDVLKEIDEGKHNKSLG